ncbi:MAG: hypothetical protein K1X79_09315 [Oligoflexia bacterium]|nr:hypothetical protein [Oligoflexia bacterium]
MSILAAAAFEPRASDPTIMVEAASAAGRERAVSEFAGLGRVFDDGGALMVLNLATDQIDEGSATTLGHLQATSSALAVASLLSTKAFLASRGYCVVPESLRSDMESYARYAEEHGLVPAGSSSNMLFVRNPLHYRVLLGLLAQIGKDVVPYMDTQGFAELAESQAVTVRGSSPQSPQLVTAYANKSVLRDFLLGDVLGKAPDLGITGFLDYPRIVLPRGSQTSLAKLAQDLRQASTYYSKQTIGEERVLFVQVADAAGGNGNTVVYRSGHTYRMLDFQGREISCANVEELAGELLVMARCLDLEVTPFLNIVQSYSISIMVSDSGVSLLGPRTQILDPQTHAFLASNFDCMAPPGQFVELQRMLTITIAFGQELGERGFRGHTDLDVIEYRDQAGDVRVSVSESNMRRNAPSHLIALILQQPELCRRLVDGQLSFILDDHVDISCGCFDAEQLAKKIAASGIPMLSAHAPEGVVLMSPPLQYGAGDKQHLSLGVVAATDQRKHELYARVKRLLSS